MKNRNTLERTTRNEADRQNTRPLRTGEIQDIYRQANKGRWVPDWIYNSNGEKIGYKRTSIDAWSQ